LGRIRPRAKSPSPVAAGEAPRPVNREFSREFSLICSPRKTSRRLNDPSFSLYHR
jgi:hypothetical protein